MWNCEITELTTDQATRYQIFEDGSPMGYIQVADLWSRDHGFREFFVQLLINSPFAAFRWETPVVTRSSFAREFEFVLLSAPELCRRVDRRAFAAHFVAPSESEAMVVQFQNLGRDAHLVVPCPDDSVPDVFGHLASFVRGASGKQVHALWETVGQVMLDCVGDKPVWLSTAGMGVSWLHVRFDSRPKYYGFAPYRSGDSGSAG